MMGRFFTSNESNKSKPVEEVYVSPFSKSSRTLISELCDDFRELCAQNEGKLILDRNSFTSATFNWCLLAMGLNCLTVLVEDPLLNIIYDEACTALTITGVVVTYEGWKSAKYDITISSGNSEHTILYANCKIEAVYDTFSLPMVAGSKLIPPGSISAEVLPLYSFDNVPISVVSTSKSTLPNCELQFGVINMVRVVPEWVIHEELNFVSDSVGFMVSNSLNKGGVVVRSFLLNGNLSFGDSCIVPITLTTPVGYFSQKEMWQIGVTNKQKPVVSVDGMSSRAGSCDLHKSFPPLFIAHLKDGCILNHYHVQYNPYSHHVYQLTLTASAAAAARAPVDADAPADAPVDADAPAVASTNTATSTDATAATIAANHTISVVPVPVPASPPAAARDTWEVIPGELAIHNTTFGVTSYNPCSLLEDKTVSINILGKCGVAACDFEPILSVGYSGAAVPIETKTEWCFDIWGDLPRSKATPNLCDEFSARLYVDFSDSAGAKVVSPPPKVPKSR
jgi:hypothetical protein